MNARMIRTVLFDLDGTFADTAPDLAYALNQVLLNNGQAELPLETIRPAVSHGGNALISLGFNMQLNDDGFEELRQQLLVVYQDNICRHTRLFPGINELILELETLGISWGIVTNKPSWLTDPLVHALGLSERSACIVSGDTTANPKPHPDPILFGCEKAQCLPEECLYVGDAERDIEAGRRAGTSTLVALFGYIDAEDKPESWGADGSIQHPNEILTWIKLALDSTETAR